MKIVYYHCITPIHVGSGSNLGVVDLPVYREIHTDFPVIPSSAIKGVLRARYEMEVSKEEAKKIFGSEEKEENSEQATLQAGEVIFTDAKILLFPVKSLKGVFVWITSPLVISRFVRDTGKKLDIDFSKLTETNALVSSDRPVVSGKVILEEFSFDAVKEEKIKQIKDIVKHSIDPEKIVVLPDNIFRFFVKNYTEIVARIRIDQAKGTVKEGGLWYQELVPAETVYYSCMMSRVSDNDSLEKISQFINGKTLQFGGDETLGRGYTKIVVEG